MGAAIENVVIRVEESGIENAVIRVEEGRHRGRDTRRSGVYAVGRTGRRRPDGAHAA